MKYRIVSAETIGEVADEVNALLAEGWLLFGGVAVSNWCFRAQHGDIVVQTEYCQAMRLEEKSHDR